MENEMKRWAKFVLENGVTSSIDGDVTCTKRDGAEIVARDVPGDTIVYINIAGREMRAMRDMACWKSALRTCDGSGVPDEQAPLIKSKRATIEAERRASECVYERGTAQRLQLAHICAAPVGVVVVRYADGRLTYSVTQNSATSKRALRGAINAFVTACDLVGVDRDSASSVMCSASDAESIIRHVVESLAVRNWNVWVPSNY